MQAFTLRLEPPLAKKLDKICKQKGYSKTGLVKSLIKDFITHNESGKRTLTTKSGGLASLVGIVNLGGDSVKDKRDLFY